MDELKAENITNSNDAYNRLKLPTAGLRQGYNGSFYYSDYLKGYMWTNEATPTGAYPQTFDSTSGEYWSHTYRVNGLSVRCTED